MTKKNMIVLSLIALYAALIFAVGCVPEDSLQWSQDGSVGLYSKNHALFLVNGRTGSLTPIEPNESTTPWPAISADGNLVAYGLPVLVNDFDESLKLVPSEQIEILKNDAEEVRKSIQKKLNEDSSFKTELLGEGLFADEILKSYNGEYRKWVAHYLFKKLDNDGSIAKKLGDETVERALKEPMGYFKLVLTPANDLSKKNVLAVSIRRIWKVSFSPDGRLLAYIIDRTRGDAFESGFDLFVCSLSEKTGPELAAEAIAIGYDFRDDSRAIAYMKPENVNFNSDKFTVGTLVEQILIDPNGNFKCTGNVEELVGVCYYTWMFVSYAPGNRIFFSSAKITLPSGKLDEEKASLFCYDGFTGAVGEMIPSSLLDSAGSFYLYAPSHNSRKILIPGNKNTLGLYMPGENLDSAKILINKDEGFGDDAPPKLAAGWKGPDEITCMVSEKSHFLTKDPDVPHRRKEIVILDADGNLRQILSRDWPDELLNF
jgi:hypothetical protein